MRTCPACGEDTEAGYAEACTECGFSAMGEQEPAPAEVEPVGEASQQPPSPEPEPAPAGRKRRSPARLLIWLVVIAGFFGVQRLGVFDDATRPDPEQVEQAIADSAPRGVDLTVECPDDAEDTPVDGTFTCTATTPDGRAIEVVVTNHEETFEWESGPLTTLS